MTDSVARPAPELPGRAFSFFGFPDRMPYLPSMRFRPPAAAARSLQALAGLMLLTCCASSPVRQIDLARQGTPWIAPAGAPNPTCPQNTPIPLAPIRLFRDVSWDSAASWLDQASGAEGSPFLPDSIRFTLIHHEDLCASLDSGAHLKLFLHSRLRPVDSLRIPWSLPRKSRAISWEMSHGMIPPRIEARWQAPVALGEPPVSGWFQRMGQTFQSPEPTWFREAIWDGVSRRVLHLPLTLHGRDRSDTTMILKIDLDSLRLAPSNATEGIE